MLALKSRMLSVQPMAEPSSFVYEKPTAQHHTESSCDHLSIEVQNQNEDGRIKIFVSYSPNYRPEDVRKIARKFGDLGFDVWIDINHNPTKGIMAAIDQADLVLMFFNERYRESSDCESEAKYADMRRKRIIGVDMDGSCVNGWLGFILSECPCVVHFSQGRSIEDAYHEIRGVILQQARNKLSHAITRDNAIRKPLLPRRGSSTQQTAALSSLTSAVRYGHLELVQNLHRKYPDAINNVYDGENQTILMLAARNGHFEIVRFLYDKLDPEVIEKTSNDGLTAFTYAARKGSLSIVKFFYEKNPATIAANGVKSFLMAAMLGHLLIVMFLVEKDVSLLTYSHLNQSGLQLAAFCGHLHVVKFFKSRHCDVDKYKHAVAAAAESGNHEIVHFLANEGTFEEHKAAFLHVARIGYLHALQLIYSKNLSLIKAVDEAGMSAMFHAAEGGHFEVVIFLYEKNPDSIRAVSKSHASVIMRTAFAGHLDIVEFLYEAYPEGVSLKNQQGWTAVIAAASNGHLSVVKYLVGRNPALLDDVDCSELTAFIHAVIRGRLDVVRFISEEKGVEVMKRKYSKQQMTALMFAARNNHMETVAFLYESYSEAIAVQDVHGNTALFHAAEQGFIEVVRFLATAHPESVGLKNNDGLTPSMRAAENGYLDVVKFLFEFECCATEAVDSFVEPISEAMDVENLRQKIAIPLSELLENVPASSIVAMYKGQKLVSTEWNSLLNPAQKFPANSQDNLSLLQSSLEVLSGLSNNDHNFCEEFLNNGGLQVLEDLLASAPGANDVQLKVLEVLDNLAEFSDFHSKLTSSEPFVSDMLALLSSDDQRGLLAGAIFAKLLCNYEKCQLPKKENFAVELSKRVQLWSVSEPKWDLSFISFRLVAPMLAQSSHESVRQFALYLLLTVVKENKNNRCVKSLNNDEGDVVKQSLDDDFFQKISTAISGDLSADNPLTKNLAMQLSNLL